MPFAWRIYGLKMFPFPIERHIYHFCSRDPNTSRTLDAFTQSVDWATQGQFKDDDINEAKLSVFSAVS